MMDREFYITGTPIQTKFGSIRFLTYLEYLNHMSELNTIRLNVFHLYYQYKKQFNLIEFEPNEKKEILESLEEMKNQSLHSIVMSNSSSVDAYFKILKLVIDSEDSLEKIFDDAEIFMQIREIVMDMNFIHEEEVSPNEEIQGYIEKSKEMKQRGAGNQSFSDIVSSVVVGSGLDYSTVFNMTVLQLYATYYRIAAVKDFEISTLFATVSDKQKIESWHKHINLFENEKEGMSMEQFNTQFGSLF
ncbi:MAG TPA: hypothetical protein VI423_10985 [Paenisporosarcina sp.]|nr:hypothetical protein [Paenisporosarcina sp.]